MKIFIDSADLNEIRQAREWGVMDGVTTNPSLLKKAVEKREKSGISLNLRDYIAEILEVSEGMPVSLEVTETEADRMISQGMKIYEMFNSLAGNVYVKIPVNPAFKAEGCCHFDGLKAIKALSLQGIPVNCTLIFTSEQALLAAKSGARIVSPFAGRVDDHLRKQQNREFSKGDYYPSGGVEVNGKVFSDNGIASGIELVSECVQVLSIHGFETEVLAASLRNPRQVREAALVGAHISTLPFNVIEEMLKHHKTFEGMKSFTDDRIESYDSLFR